MPDTKARWRQECDAGSVGIKLLAIIILFGVQLGESARAATPCDFKGIAVGNKMSAAEIMKVLGISQYKTDLPHPPFEAALAASQKYGLVPAAEMAKWKICPACDDTSRDIPFGVGVGNDNLPVNVHVGFRDKVLIVEIDVSFNETYRDEIRRSSIKSMAFVGRKSMALTRSLISKPRGGYRLNFAHYSHS